MTTSSSWPSTYYGIVLAVLMAEREVSDIGQFDRRQKRLLNQAVKKGDLSKHLNAGPFPKGKTAYASPGFDFVSARKARIEEIRRLAALDARGPRVKSLPASMLN